MSIVVSLVYRQSVAQQDLYGRFDLDVEKVNVMNL